MRLASPLLQHAALSHILSRLSQVYSTIKISNFLELVVPIREVATEGTYDDEQIEAYVMRCACCGELNIRVDHAANSITFADNPFAAAEDLSSSTSAAALGAVQLSTSEFVRVRLHSPREHCHHAPQLPRHHRAPARPTEEEQQAKFAALVAAAEAERGALQIRRALVAHHHELLSELSVQEKEQVSRHAEILRKQQEEEACKAAQELWNKELERAWHEIENIRVEEVRKLVQSMKEKGMLKVDVNVSLLHRRPGRPSHSCGV